MKRISNAQVAKVVKKSKPGRKKLETIGCGGHEGGGIKSKTIAMFAQVIPICRNCRGF